MSYGMLDPLTGYQARGVLSPGFQPTSTPGRTTGTDLSQFAARTAVPQQAAPSVAPVLEGLGYTRPQVDMAAAYGVPASLLNTQLPTTFMHAYQNQGVGNAERRERAQAQVAASPYSALPLHVLAPMWRENPNQPVEEMLNAALARGLLKG